MRISEDLRTVFEDHSRNFSIKNKHVLRILFAVSAVTPVALAINAGVMIASDSQGETLTKVAVVASMVPMIALTGYMFFGAIAVGRTERLEQERAAKNASGFKQLRSTTVPVLKK